LDPHPLHLGEEAVRKKTKDEYNDFSRSSFFSTFFPLPEMVVTLEIKSHLLFFSYVSVED